MSYPKSRCDVIKELTSREYFAKEQNTSGERIPQSVIAT